MKYTCNKDGDYQDFVHRVLDGQIDEDMQKQILYLLRIMVTEIGTATYSINITIKGRQITIILNHHGKKIEDNIIKIISDQVDCLCYRRLLKGNHILKIRKKIWESQKLNCLIFSRL